MNIMAVRRGSKRLLDTLTRRGNLPRVPRMVVLPLLALLPSYAAAQATGWADFWRVAATTVAGPVSLERGPTAMFWNPAAVGDRGDLVVGIDVFQTPDVLGIGGLLAGVTQRVGPRVAVGVMVGRLSVQDLIRTTTSPTSRDGEIPVFTQFAAVGVGLVVGRVQVGAALRGHDSRFDAQRAGAVTADLGIRAAPTPQLTLVAATRFAEPVFRQGPGTAYHAAAELALTTTRIWGSRFLVIGQYGIAHEERAGLEHVFTLALALDDRLRVDWGWAREQGYGTGEWRPTLALSFRAGRYGITIARADGLNGLGATFRLGLAAEILE